MNKVTKQYTLSLVRLLYKFSVIFYLENSKILKEDIIDLSKLEKFIKINDKIFDKILEEAEDIEFSLKQAKQAYNQVISYFQILKSHYNNVVANKRQLELLIGFKAQLEEHISMLEAMM